MEINKGIKGISIRIINIIITLFGLAISISLFISFVMLFRSYQALNNNTKNYVLWKDKAKDVLDASDFLTDQARSYIVCEDEIYINNYLKEVNEIKRRDNALLIIKEKINDSSAYFELETAVNESKTLSLVEYYAMRLIIYKKDLDVNNYAIEIRNVELSTEDKSLSKDELKAKAIDLLYNEEYLKEKEIIINNVNDSVNDLDMMLEVELKDSSIQLSKIILFQNIMIILLMVFIITMGFIISFTFVKPINKAIIQIVNGRKVDDSGINEYKYLANAYNTMCDKTIDRKSQLLYDSEHDHLTNIYNRTGYNKIFESIDVSKIIYILLDVDYFKHINDKYGHDVGDMALVRVSDILKSYLKESYLFRIGGDEFAAIYSNQLYSKEKIIEIIKNINNALSKETDGIPAMSLSVGVVYGDINDTTETIFRKADTALYNVKNAGRNGVQIYHDN